MIQRMQSLYWLLAAAATIAACFLPYASLYPAPTEVHLTPMGISGGEGAYQGTLPVLFLLAVAAVAQVVAIFLYKKRPWQLRLSIWAIVVLVGTVGVEVCYAFATGIRLEINWHIQFAMALPLIGAVLTYLALHAVRRDQAYLRRMSRLR